MDNTANHHKVINSYLLANDLLVLFFNLYKKTICCLEHQAVSDHIPDLIQQFVG